MVCTRCQHCRLFLSQFGGIPGRPRENQGKEDQDLEGLLLYHSALVYRELGDEKNTFGALYHAINFSKHLGQIRDIETLWSEVNEEAGTPVSVPSSY